MHIAASIYSFGVYSQILGFNEINETVEFQKEGSIYLQSAMNGIKEQNCSCNFRSTLNDEPFCPPPPQCFVFSCQSALAVLSSGEPLSESMNLHLCLSLLPSQTK